MLQCNKFILVTDDKALHNRDRYRPGLCSGRRSIHGQRVAGGRRRMAGVPAGYHDYLRAGIADQRLSIGRPDWPEPAQRGYLAHRLRRVDALGC